MTTEWTIAVGLAAPATPASLKIQGGSVEFVSRGRDQATLSANPSVTWAYGTLVGIYWQGTRIFYGRVMSNERARDPGVNADRVITVYGVQYWLERCPYRQNWLVMLSGGPGLAPSSRVILNASAADVHLSVDGQLNDIIRYAASRGCPVQFGSSAVGVTMPFEEQRDITCSQAIERSLRLTPAMCDWVDYSTVTPTIHFGQGSEFSPAKVNHDSLAWRDDLVVPGIQIEIERINTSNGAQYRTLELLSAGDLDSVDTVFISLALSGSEFNSNTRTLDVVTEEIGDYTDPDWWQAKHPRLANIRSTDITVVGAFRSAGTPDDFPRISSAPLPDLTDAGCKACLETFTATVDIVQRNSSDEEIGSEEGVELTMQFVTTNATTRTYRWQDGMSMTSAEETPAGLADALLEHWSVLYAAGSFSANISEGIPYPGQLVEGTPIQSVSVDLEAKSVTGTFGPPAHLSAQDFVTLMQTFRCVRKSMRVDSKYDATAKSENEEDMKSIAPVSASDWAPGAPTHLKIEKDGTSADINPGADLESGAEAKFRKLTFANTLQGNCRRSSAWFLSSVPVVTDDELFPWHPTFSYTTDEAGAITASSVVFANCLVQRNAIFLPLDDQTISELPSSGSFYIGVSFEASNNTGALLTGTSFTDIADTAEPPADQTFSKIPICKLDCQADGTWLRTACYFGAPQSGLW